MALDHADIAGHRGERLGEGTTYFRDHFLGRDSAVTTGLYETGGSTQSELFNRADESGGGVVTTWGGSGLPRLSSRVTALGNGKAERVTRYGTPRFGAINRSNNTYTMRSTRVERPWLLVNSDGVPIKEKLNSTLLAHNRTGSGHWLPVQRFSETLVHFTFTKREAQQAWNTFNPMIDKINETEYTISMPGSFNNIVFSTMVLRFNGVDFFTRKEHGADVIYNVYSFTYSSFGWRYQYIPPVFGATGDPRAPVAIDVETGRLYGDVKFTDIPSGG